MKETTVQEISDQKIAASAPNTDGDLRTRQGERVRRSDLERAVRNVHFAGYAGQEFAQRALAGDEDALEEAHARIGLVLPDVTEHSEGAEVRLVDELTIRDLQRPVFSADQSGGYGSCIDAGELVAWILSPEGREALGRRGIVVPRAAPEVPCGTLTPEAAAAAALNVSVDLACGECASLFYTSHPSGHPPKHRADCRTGRARTELADLVARGGLSPSDSVVESFDRNDSVAETIEIAASHVLYGLSLSTEQHAELCAEIGKLAAGQLSVRDKDDQKTSNAPLESAWGLDPTLCLRLAAEAEAHRATLAAWGYKGPDERAVELANRLGAPGPKAYGVSASECHEIAEAILDAYEGPPADCTAWLHSNLPAVTAQLTAATSAAEQLTVLGAEVSQLRAKVNKLRALISSPHLDEFFEAVRLEAAHQVDRWGTDHDEGKSHADWHALVATLLAKSTQAYWARDWDKRTHHLISTAAAVLNWHRYVTGTSQDMRPGVADDHERAPEVEA